MSGEKPLVSIIVRTKDRPKLLKRALQSIATQTYRHVEVVLVNDGGCDLDVGEMKTILGTLSFNYIRLEKNVGRAQAGNVGIENAQGTYIGFLDDDDELYPEHISTLLNFLSSRIDCSGAYTDSEIVERDYDEEGNLVSENNKGLFVSRDFSYEVLLFENYIPLICCLLKKEYLFESGGFDDSLEMFEDWDLFIRISGETPFYHIGKITAKYIQWSKVHQIAFVNSPKAEGCYLEVLSKHSSRVTPQAAYRYFLVKHEEIENVKNVLQQKEAATEIITDKLNVVEIKSEELRSRLQEAGTQNDELINRLNSSEKTNEDLITRLQEAGTQKDELIKGLNSSEKTNEDLITRLQEAELKNEELRETLKGMQSLVKDLGSKNVHIDYKLNQIQELQEELRDRQTQMQGLQEELRDRQAQMQELQEGLRDRQVQMQGLQEESKNKQVQIQELQEELRDRQVQMQGLQEESRNKQVQMQGLQEESRNKQVQIQGLQEELRNAQVQIQGLQGELRNKQVQIQGLQEESRNKQVQIQGLQEELRNAQVQIQGLQEELRNAQVQIQGLQGELRNAQVQIQGLQGELRNAQMQMQDLSDGLLRRALYLEEVQKGIGWMALEFYRRNIRDRLAPAGTKRREAYDNLLKKVKNLKKERARTFLEGVRPSSIVRDEHFIVPKISDNVIPMVDATVSVIIPTRNAGSDFHHVLERIKTQQGIRNIEIIVIDSRSEDSTVELANRYQAKVVSIHPSEFGHGRTRNYGAQFASGEYIIFLSQDAIPIGDTCFSTMIHGMKKDPNIAAVSARQIPRSDADLFACWQIWNHYEKFLRYSEDKIISIDGKAIDLLDPADKRRVAQIDNIFSCVRGDIFKKFMFNEVKYAEDLDLGLRLIKNGYKIGFLSSVGAIHSHNRDSTYYFKRSYVDRKELVHLLGINPTNWHAIGIDSFPNVVKYIQATYGRMDSVFHDLANGVTIDNFYASAFESLRYLVHMRPSNNNKSGNENGIQSVIDALVSISGMNGTEVSLSEDVLSQQFFSAFESFKEYLSCYEIVDNKPEEIISALYKLCAVVIGANLGDYAAYSELRNKEDLGRKLDSIFGGGI